MKKIIAIVALAIVSIIIGFAAFATANSSDSYSPEQESKIALMADAAHVDVSEMKTVVARARKSCKAGRDIRTNEKLTVEQNTLCLQLAELNIVDMK